MREYIIINAKHLDYTKKLQILTLVLATLGDSYDSVIIDPKNKYDTKIDLTKCGRLDPDLIKSIYRIVFSYINIINTPL